MGRFDEAIAHYRKALEILPGYPDASGNLARLTADMSAKADSATGHAGAATRRRSRSGSTGR